MADIEIDDPCQEFIEYHEDDYTYLLKEGTVLYSGNTMNKYPLTLQDIFGYIGQRDIKTLPEDVTNFVLYASSNFETAWGYAKSCISNKGYIHKFRITKDVLLLRGDVFEDAELVDRCICTPYEIYYGYMVLYGFKGDVHYDEYALCNSENYLEYIESVRCEGRGQHGQWVDVTVQTGGGLLRSKAVPNLNKMPYREVRKLAKKKGIKVTEQLGKYKTKPILIKELRKLK